MYSFIKYVPAGLAHSLAPLGLRLYADFYGSEKTPKWQSFHWRGLEFSNRLGIAGGVDKDADNIGVWQKLGCGFVEIGTVTPHPQIGNPGKVLARDWESSNLWNKMGFPSSGAREVQMNLLHSETKVPLFVNIGKNRLTPNEQAVDDYLTCVDLLREKADIFVINVSSPNTKGLRDLQSKFNLTNLISKITRRCGDIPVLVKLSPDLNEMELHDSISASLDSGAGGFVLTNTTVQRPPNTLFPTDGGMAGKYLSLKSKQFLQETIRILGKQREGLLLVSVGGVLDHHDVEERLKLGADLVEVYSALVFKGPGFFHQVANSIQKGAGL